MLVDYDSLLEKIKRYNPDFDIISLQKACDFAQIAHQGQTRASGEPYFYHPLAVAEILADLKLDSASIIAAILHDTIEDTETTLEQIKKKFSDEIAMLVDGLTKLDKIKYQSEDTRQAENYRKLLMATSNDVRVLLIKLADRLHNMRTLKYISRRDKRYRIAKETNDIYAPLAERIGMHVFKNELQDRAFKELQPDVRTSITNRLNLLRNDSQSLIAEISNSLQKLVLSAGLDCMVLGREKTPYSIWHKMQKKSISFEQITDVMAFRIVVRNPVDCYQALGIIHQHYHTVPGSFQDFISTPKKNGYQSIHSAVLGPKGHRIEIQIRTHEMHQRAENGVASHWCYKQDYKGDDVQKYNWTKELINILDSAQDFHEFLQSTKMENNDEYVYCFTPKGQVIALPNNSSAVDFAFAVHSDLGKHCIGAKINNRVAPLNAKLRNGDQVKIITDPHKERIIPGWLEFVTTSRAINEIRKHIRHSKKQEYISLGKMMLTQTLTQYNIDLSEKNLQPALTALGKKTIDDLFQNIGEGLIARENVIKLLQLTRKPYSLIKKKLFFFNFGKKKTKQEEEEISIKGLTPGVAVHFAKCCHPIPGDRIVGVPIKGRGVDVHLLGCEWLHKQRGSHEGWLDLSWGKESSKKIYIATIKAIMLHQPGSLASLTAVIAKQDANISNFRINNRSADFFDISVDLEVRGTSHLSNIIASLRSQPCIHSVTRTIEG